MWHVSFEAVVLQVPCRAYVTDEGRATLNARLANSWTTGSRRVDVATMLDMIADDAIFIVAGKRRSTRRRLRQRRVTRTPGWARAEDQRPLPG